MNQVIIKQIIYKSQDYKKTIELRDKYFRRPQGLSIYDDDLSSDKDKDMYGAFLDGELVGTVFLSSMDKDTGLITSVIVDENYRGFGYGRLVMDFAHGKAKDRPLKKIRLKARTSAKGFYENLGYKPVSEEFLYKTIPHLYMEREV